MEAVGDALLYVFYFATVAALAFFVHKVLWLVQYRRLQQAIVGDAVQRLQDGNAQGLAEWEVFAKERWARSLGEHEVHGPSTFIRRVEEGLGQVRRELRTGERSVEKLFSDALATGKAAPRDQPPATVLSLRRLTPPKDGGPSRYDVTVDLRFPAVTEPRPPDKRLYELNVRSRYGPLRRALVFFSGAADVFYSSQHVARMSQNVHIPASTLVRRLSLVFLVLFFVFLDFVFAIRRHLSAAIELAIAGSSSIAPASPLSPHGPHGAHGPALVAAPVNTGAHIAGLVLGFLAWVSIYGTISLVMYFSVRRRYETSLRRLRQMLVDEPTTLRNIHDGHVADLVRWASEYGRSLDRTVELTVRHAETLIDHYGHRLRRRIAGPALLDAGKTIADCLFLKLPESRGELADAATEHKHSLSHHIWPRPDEMGYQERIAQYRAAWQRLELAVTELRREQPDPVLAHETWRAATSYATVFAHMLPSGLAEDLQHAYAQMVAECVGDTDKDLAELDRRLGELRRSLSEQLEAARSLVHGRVELVNGEIQAAVASLAAEVIQVREQARLEAMAFEI